MANSKVKEIAANQVAEVNAVETASVEQDAKLVAENEGKDQVLDYAKRIKELVADGWKRRVGIKVKNVNAEEHDNYWSVVLTLTQSIPGYVRNEETDEYELGNTQLVFTSNYNLAGCIKENDELSFLGNTFRDKPKAINMLLNGGTIDIISKEVAEGEEYINPFATDAEPVVFDHNTIINMVVGMSLGKNGEETVREMRRAFAMSLID